MANPDDLKKLYLRTLPLLSIDNAKVRDVDSEDLKIIEADSKRKDVRIEALEKHQGDYDKRQESIDKLLDNDEFIVRLFERFKDMDLIL
ncbi:MAG: hypothetical protein ABFC34_00290 [Methanobacterium sp.]